MLRTEFNIYLIFFNHKHDERRVFFETILIIIIMLIVNDKRERYK